MKKTFALLCCFALIIAVMPFAVYAEGYTEYTDENGLVHYVDDDNVLLGEYYVTLVEGATADENTNEFFGIKTRDIKKFSGYSYLICIDDISKCAEAEAALGECEEVYDLTVCKCFTAVTADGSEQTLRYHEDSFGPIGDDYTIYGSYILSLNLPVSELLQYDFSVHGIELDVTADMSFGDVYVCEAVLGDIRTIYQAEAVFEGLEMIRSFDRNSISFPDNEEPAKNDLYVNADDYSELEGYASGDVNANGEIDVYDYILVKRAYFQTYTLSFEEKGRANAYDDDIIDQFDYLQIKRDYFKP